MTLMRLAASRILFLLAAITCLSRPAAAQVALPDQLTLFANWYAGEWNNNEQVWQQKNDAADVSIVQKEDAVEHLHDIVSPVQIKALGENVFYVQHAKGAAKDQILHQHIVSLSLNQSAQTIQQHYYQLKNPSGFVDAHLKPHLFQTFSATDWLSSEACHIDWRYSETEKTFKSVDASGTCSWIALKSMNATEGSKIVFSGKLSSQLYAKLWQIRSTQHVLIQSNRSDTAIKSRKVRYFEGWLWFKTAGPGASEEDKNTSFTAKYSMHSEGQRVPVLYQDGTPSPYLIELATLTYQNTRKSVLKFTLLNHDTLKTLTYVWANADATTIGMNLGWFQAGVAQKADRIAFGF